MREILIADKSGERCDVSLVCVVAVWIRPGAQVLCRLHDGGLVTVSRECVHRLGSVDLAVASAPEADGLWALNYAGKWVEARRQ